MFSGQKQSHYVVAGLAAFLALTGCGNPNASQSDTRRAGETRPAATGQDNQAIRSAAEPFEGLTEKAFSGSWAELDKLIAEARTGVARAGLNGANSALAARRLEAIAQARSAQDRVQLALAAVEGYKELIEFQNPASADPPVEISLLDYAGFRYDALAQAPNVDWQEMARSAEFARQKWQIIAPKFSSKALRGVVDQSLLAMVDAAKKQDISFARSAAATELALVDLLEEQIASGR